MAYEQKNMNGVLFVNDRKDKETHPDYKGSATVNGVEMWVSGWRKSTKDGKKYLSLAFKAKEGQQQSAPQNQQPQPEQDPGFGDEIPF